MALADPRRFVRSVFPENGKIQVWFRVDDHFVEGTPLEISMGGLLVEPPLRLKAGVAIGLRMVLEELTVEGPCTIRRATGKTLCLLFGSKNKPLDAASRGTERNHRRTDESSRRSEQDHLNCDSQSSPPESVTVCPLTLRTLEVTVGRTQ